MFKKKKLRTYALTGLVSRTVHDTIDLTVEAEDEGMAYAEARKALARFPDAHQADGVKTCYIRERNSQSVDILDISEQEDEGARA